MKKVVVLFSLKRESKYPDLKREYEGERKKFGQALAESEIKFD